MLSVYMWGYFCPTYIRRTNVSVPAGSARYNTLILQHLNAFNKILSDLLALEVKLEEEDKTLLLLSSLPSSYDHLATTIMYGEE